VDLGKVNRQLCILQSNLRRLLGTSAPWTKWPNEWAFRRGVPEFYREGMDENQQASCIPVLCDGTIAQICKLTLPSMKAALEIRGIIKVKPLSSYRNWAFRVEKELLTQAHELQMEFNVRVSRVNWSDPEEITPFHLWWQGRVREWARSVGVSEKTAACALWREAHSSRSEDSSAASVFIGFPEEAKWVIAEKPGKRDSGVNTLLVGLNYVFDQEPNRLACEVAIREFEQVKNNKRVVRKIVCGNVQGKMDARQPYPADMLGMVDLQGEQPDVGCYQASITKAGRGMAWHCTLVAL